MQNKKDRILSKDYLLISACFTAALMLVNLYMPTMAMYTKLISNSDMWAGYMTGIFAVASVISRRCSVSVMKKFGNARTIALGATICIVSCFFYMNAKTIPILVAARLVQGFGTGLATTPTSAAIAEVVPPSRFMEGIAYFSLMQTVVAAVAPAMAVDLVSGATGADDYRILFFLAGGFSALNLLMSFGITYEKKGTFDHYREIEKQQEKERKESKGDAAGKESRVILGIETIQILPLLVVFMTHCSQVVVTAYLSMLAAERGLSSVALFYTVSAVSVFVARMLTGKVADRHGSAVLIVPSLIVLVISLCLIATARSAMFLVVMGVPFGMASGIMQPTLNGLIFKIGQPERRSQTAAAYNLVGDVTGVLVSFVIGSIVARIGYTTCFFACAVFAGVGLILYIIADIEAARYMGHKV